MTPPPPLARDAFDLDPDVLWIMHCAEGPVPVAAARAVREFLAIETQPWRLDVAGHFYGIPSDLREEYATLIGADAVAIALTATTSSGLMTVAQSFPWELGDEVLAPLGEFPSNSWPWRALGARGVTVREVPLWDGHRSGAACEESTAPPPGADPESRLLDAIGPRTRILTASWVRFQDGLRLDLVRLGRGCRERGVRFVVDGIQGAGTLPVALGDIDAFACGGHKGLLAPQGSAFLYTSDEMRDVLAPCGSWLSVEGHTDFALPMTDFEKDWCPDGRRFEQGVPNLLGAVAQRESLRMMRESGGPTRIAEHVAGLQSRLLGALEAAGRWTGEVSRVESLLNSKRLGSILSFHHRGMEGKTLADLMNDARRHGIYASSREGYLRIALHGWHDEDDVDRITRWLVGTGDA